MHSFTSNLRVCLFAICWFYLVPLTILSLRLRGVPWVIRAPAFLLSLCLSGFVLAEQWLAFFQDAHGRQSLGIMIWASAPFLGSALLAGLRRRLTESPAMVAFATLGIGTCSLFGVRIFASGW